MNKRKWACYYINGRGAECVRFFSSMDDGLAFCAKLDKRITRGTCGGYSFSEV